MRMEAIETIIEVQDEDSDNSKIVLLIIRKKWIFNGFSSSDDVSNEKSEELRI